MCKCLINYYNTAVAQQNEKFAQCNLLTPKQNYITQLFAFKLGCSNYLLNNLTGYAGIL